MDVMKAAIKFFHTSKESVEFFSITNHQRAFEPFRGKYSFEEL